MNAFTPEDIAHIVALLNQWARSTVREEIQREFNRRFGRIDERDVNETVRGNQFDEEKDSG